MPSSPSQQRLERLIEVNRLVSGALDSKELLSTILTAICDLFDAEGCSLLTVEPRTGELIFHTIKGGSEELLETKLQPDQGIVGWVVTNKESVIVNDPAKDPRFYSGIDQKADFQTRSILCAPMELQGEILGAIEAINSRRPEGFGAEDLRLLEAFASQASVALRNAQTHARVTMEKDAYRQELDSQFRSIIGSSKAIREVIDLAQRVARTKSTVLLRGESGTGKEVFARAIHNWSPRSEKPMMVVNSVALSPELLESELFGHEKGSFTGAIAQKKGKFEIADGGSVFLDEIGDIGANIQTKLLRVLQEHEFERVGGTTSIKSDIRVIAATNRDLEKAVSENKFREDLYYRLNVVTLVLPPLRDRLEDIHELVPFFVKKATQDLGIPPVEVSEEAIEKLMTYHWPGNVRQLSNVVERAVVLAQDESLGPDDFQLEQGKPIQSEDPIEELPLSEAVDEFKIRLVRRALRLERGNQTKAAKRLGIQQPNLSRMMKNLDIRVGE
ncbi:MAG: sigma 54-interacting transcriptional regulator [Candidatus Omnitrophica bacterium]|nr:sigma 54-interacting transcriptional regulator [Candidatus Omnitrophota bacterium]